jgi:tetrahedral aminopeptidase
VSTVQEEVGLRGAQTAAYGLDPHVGIAVDVHFASDNPGQEAHSPVSFKLGKGPGIFRGPNVNPVVEQLLLGAAKKKRIPHQILPAGRLLGNDARAMQVARAGVATGALVLPSRYLHTQVEMCSLDDLERASELLAQFLESMTPKTELRPL